jgi:hypothetical protein
MLVPALIPRIFKWVIRCKDLIRHFEVSPPLICVDWWQPTEERLKVSQRLRSPLLTPRTVGHDIGDRLAIPSHRKAFTRLDAAHDLGIVIAKLPLRYRLAHAFIIALWPFEVLQGCYASIFRITPMAAAPR